MKKRANGEYAVAEDTQNLEEEDVISEHDDEVGVHGSLEDEIEEALAEYDEDFGDEEDMDDIEGPSASYDEDYDYDDAD